MSDQQDFFGKLLTFEGQNIDMREEWRRRDKIVAARNLPADARHVEPPEATGCTNGSQKPPFAPAKSL